MIHGMRNFLAPITREPHMAIPQPPDRQANTSPPRSGDYYFRSPPPDNPPDPKKHRWVWWLVGGVIVFLLLIGLAGSLVVLGVRNIGPARDATTEYVADLKTHDWMAAQAHLSASLRATTKPADLEATWLRREQADGAIDQFKIASTNVSVVNGKTTATVTGMLSYASGATDPKTITLVKEDTGWKLSSLP